MRCLNGAILSFALLLRILVGFQPHSGQDDYQGNNATGIGTDANDGGKPIKYGGDYEAQRHWMEITYHLPISEWYYHDLEYWGLDYPVLTAYVSWVCGWVAHTVGSIHNDAFVVGENEETILNNGVCKWDDSVCIDQLMRTKKNQKAGKINRKSSKGLGVLKDLVALHSSRWGFEESGGKLYMRFTVLLLDLLVYMSAVWVLAGRLTKIDADDEVGTNNTTIDPDSTTSTTNKSSDDSIIPISQRPRLWLLLAALSQPALILIDHGHFQYNTVSLGLALWSFHFMTLTTTTTTTTNHSSKSDCSSFVGPILGSILFSLALNFKQMELYHAPAIFAYLLGRCFRRDRNKEQYGSTVMGTAGKFCVLGLTVILTFATLYAPFAIYTRASTSPISSLLQIVQRLFPFNRGVFEGKVANLWCALSIKPFSIRDRLPSDLLPWAALGLTLILVLPPCWILFGAGKGPDLDKSAPVQSNQNPNNMKDDSDIRLLLWGTTSTSLAFFLASFQVHEK
ncbi:hypothetical protein ACHAXR_001739, partial [Thalassiosira sp. AJA248-18]